MAKRRLIAERVRHPHNECYCDWCGYPRIVGDRLLVDLDSGRVYCSHECAGHDADSDEYRDCRDAVASLHEDE